VAARVRDLVGATADDAPAVRTHANETEAWVPGMRPPPRHGGGSETERWRDRLRWDPGRRGLIALALAVVVVVAATGWWLAAGRPKAMPISATGPAPTDATGAAESSPVSAVSVLSSPVPSLSNASPPAAVPATSGGAVVVDVAGKVRRPGVYTLPSGARVYEALRAAGGVRHGANTVSLNLAAVLQDGQQIVVGVPAGAVAPMPVSGSGGASSPAALINLNTATLEELESLPGVGPVLGQNILDWRAAHQQFTSVDQLSDVTGIGDVRLAQLRPLVTV
jgi:competence protein ComEA